jgi:hypothetical protein
MPDRFRFLKAIANPSAAMNRQGNVFEIFFYFLELGETICSSLKEKLSIFAVMLLNQTLRKTRRTLPICIKIFLRAIRRPVCSVYKAEKRGIMD